MLFNDTTGNDNLLGVGWLARSNLKPEVPNLFNVSMQDLITYSIAKDTLFKKENLKVVLGAYSFDVPPQAADDDTYSIKINRPSATSDGYGAPGSDVYIEAPSHGSLTNGPINAQKTVRVGHRRYTVGDVYPFRWLNAGDFGDTNLLSADVAQVFQTAIYDLNVPIKGSDMEDGMDSCCGTGVVGADNYLHNTGTSGDIGNLYDGNDTTINSFVFGDGVLDVRDIFVTYRRSLDPSLNWFERFYTNGFRVAVVRSNSTQSPRPAPTKKPSNAARFADSTIAPLINFMIGDFSVVPGQTISVPIQATVFGNYPLRVMQLNVTVQAMDGSPAITNAIQFSSVGLGQPSLIMSSGPNNYSAAWLNNAISGISGTGVIGTLQITIPANATASSAYRIHFDHISASPNGLARFDQHVQDGLVLLASRTNSTWGDGIPDTWRLRYFGSLGNVLSQANADADGDKVSNWAEYKMGTDPNDVSSYLHLMKPKTSSGLTVRWPSVGNKHYLIECAPALFDAAWSVISTNIVGDGQEMEFTDATQISGTRFYRVRVSDE